ncbi:MAG: EscU/YscU/HrcU family type III secretion system export apparatus switch protein [Ectothiorhodospiraceae bacterium]|jgi:flagellar biosynthesis protein
MTRRNPPQTLEHDRRLAVALEYTGDGAPRVTAKGAGAVAEEIMRLAQEHDVPLRPDRDLVEVLAQVDLNREIPEMLYRAVAEVIAFAYFVKGKTPEGYREKDDR